MKNNPNQNMRAPFYPQQQQKMQISYQRPSTAQHQVKPFWCSEQVSEFDPKSLPVGGINKGIVIQLKCNCPQYCICKSQEIRIWRHKCCNSPAFINQYGDIFCKNFQNKQECAGYFIQHAKFQCQDSQKNNTWESFNSATQFLMALAQGMTSASFTLSENDIVQFGTTLNQEVLKRWNK